MRLLERFEGREFTPLVAAVHRRYSEIENVVY